MEIILIRHGQSEANALKGDNKIYTGQWDCNLTEIGYQQAKELSKNTILDDVDVFISSNLKRAKETARTLTSKEIVIDSRINERSLGDFEGKRIIDIMNNPKYYKFFNDPKYISFRHSFNLSAPNGETYQDVCDRIKPFLKDLFNSNYKKVVIVAHYVVIQCLLKELNGLSEEEALSSKIPNCTPIKIMI